MTVLLTEQVTQMTQPLQQGAVSFVRQFPF